MLIKPFLQNDGSLYLDVYSNDATEFSTVKDVIQNAGATPEAHDLESPGKRTNKRFVLPNPDREKFQQYMRAEISKGDHKTLVEFDNEGDIYHCKGINEKGEELDELTFMAKNTRVADVKAGLLANNNDWFDTQIGKKS